MDLLVLQFLVLDLRDRAVARLPRDESAVAVVVRDLPHLHAEGANTQDLDPELDPEPGHDKFINKLHLVFILVVILIVLASSCFAAFRFAAFCFAPLRFVSLWSALYATSDMQNRNARWVE